MSTNYTNLTSLSVGPDSAAGAVSVSITSSGLSVTNVTASSLLSTTSANQAATANFTALTPTTSFMRITGTIAFNIKGIVAGADGQQLEIYNATGQNMTITPQSTAVATVANRIIIMTTASSIVTTAAGYACFRYSTTDSRWLCKYVTL